MLATYNYTPLQQLLEEDISPEELAPMLESLYADYVQCLLNCEDARRKESATQVYYLRMLYKAISAMAYDKAA